MKTRMIAALESTKHKDRRAGKIILGVAATLVFATSMGMSALAANVLQPDAWKDIFPQSMESIGQLESASEPGDIEAGIQPTLTSPIQFDTSDTKELPQNKDISFRTTMGHNVVSMTTGEVILLNRIEDGVTYTAAGNFIQILAPTGEIYWYVHLTEIDVELGDKVEIGQVIGTAGTSGSASYPQCGLVIKSN